MSKTPQTYGIYGKPDLTQGRGVYYRRLELSPHPADESLQIARADDLLFVVRRGEYAQGEGAFVIPEFSVILNPDLRKRFETQLIGKDGNVVAPISIRGQPHMGILVHPREAFALLSPSSVAMVVQSNVDYSELFGVA